MVAPKIGVVIPTVGRCDELRRTLKSLAEQTHPPDQVVILDEAGEANPMRDEFARLNICVSTFPRGASSVKRNRGVKLLSADIELIAFMDDDIVVEPAAIQAVLDFWRDSGVELGGVGLNLVNHPPLFASRLKSLKVVKMLSLYDSRRGAVLRSGFHTLIGYVEETTFVEWLPSTAVVYRREALNEHLFDEWYEGYSYLEDLDLSYSIGRKYRLAVLAGARYCHYPSPVGRTDSYSFGKMEVANRFHFVREHADLSPARCALALTVRMLMSLFLGITKLDGSYFRRAAGNVAGFLSPPRRRAQCMG